MIMRYETVYAWFWDLACVWAIPALPFYPSISRYVSWSTVRPKLLRIKAQLDPEVKRIKFTMHQKVSEMPSLNQAELFRIVEGERELKKLAFRQLLDKERLECKGLWSRRYFLAERAREERQRIEVLKRKPQLHRKVLRKPGIADTEPLDSVKYGHDLKETVIRQLLDECQLVCEQKGRVRRYFPKRRS